ncbi:MAG: Smr/MutS family protein [Thermoanaerobaculia bacterium]
MTFAPGDPVHVKAIGKGTVREVRNGGRYLVEVKGRSIQTSADQLTAIEDPANSGRALRAAAPRSRAVYEASSGASSSLDLHGYTVDEALEAVAGSLNAALLAGNAELRIIHGRSGGKIKAAVHAQLKRIASVRRFKIDPANAGVTIVTL